MDTTRAGGSAGLTSYVPPTPQAGKRCWINVWPDVATSDGFHAPGHHTLYLPLNPELQLTRAIRTTATQTIHGAWVDNFGLGVGILTLAGHTGWASGAGTYNGQPVNGFQAFQALWYDIVDYYFALQSQQATQTPAVTMQFGNDVDAQFFTVMPTSSPQPFSVQRSKAKPYLYQYTLSLIILRDNNHPGAVSPIADPIDPLINVSPGMALSQSTVPVVNVSPSPVSTSLPGRSLKYVVKAGDTLSGIAVQFGARDLIAAEDAIAQASHVANKNLIFVGQVLIIPQPLP